MEVKDSPIHGKGLLFTTVDLKKGQKIYDYVGIEMLWKDYHGDYHNTYSLRRVGKIIVGSSDNPCQWLNMSDKPNVILKKRGLYALTDIQAGDELTLQKYFKGYKFQ